MPSLASLQLQYLIDDYENMSVLPIEVKSGRDYKIHSAINRFLSHGNYPVSRAFVLSNERCVFREGGILYMPIYYIMFLNSSDWIILIQYLFQLNTHLFRLQNNPPIFWKVYKKVLNPGNRTFVICSDDDFLSSSKVIIKINSKM